MKAVVLKKNGYLSYEDRPTPSLKPAECLVEVTAAGVCSSDVARAFDRGAYHYPLIMGHEIAGRVVVAGAKVRRFKSGDRVAIFPLIPCRRCDSCGRQDYVCCARYDYFGSRRDGGFADSITVPEWNLIRLPVSVRDDVAAVLEPMAVVARALTRGGFLTGNDARVRHATILGAGFLGQVAARMLTLCHPSLLITVIDRHKWKLNLLKGKNLRRVPLATPTAWKKFLQTNEASFDFVLEACGAPETYRASLLLGKPKSTIVWMGNISDDLKLEKKTVSSILRKEMTILGTWNSGFSPMSANDWTTVFRLLKKGLDISKLITHKTSLKDLPMALKQLHRHKQRIEPKRWLKVVVDVAA